MTTSRMLPVLALLVLAACDRAAPQSFTADADRLMDDVRALAAPEMAGRRTGTAGIAKARDHIRGRFVACGVEPIGDTYGHPFLAEIGGEPVGAINLVGRVAGRGEGADAIVVTAHYDHEGVVDGTLYPGADDNASGVAMLLALACHYAERPLEHDLILAALDAEESGLQGAYAFVADPPVALETIVLNVNLDMVSRDTEGRLWAVGTRQFPVLKPLAEAAAQGVGTVELRFGYDDPDLPRGQSWVLASDHAAFYRAGIPFLYFGVEDHADYSRPTDTPDKIDPAFFAGAATLIGRFIAAADASLEPVRAARTEPLEAE